MKKDLIAAYSDELRFLLKLKETMGKLNNRIHDKLALIAIEKLKAKFPELIFHYAGAGGAGIDVQAFDRKKHKLVVAEVKTTLLFDLPSLRGPQKYQIQKDLGRLSGANAKHKFLIVLSKKVKLVIERQLNMKKEYPGIEVINALDE